MTFSSSSDILYLIVNNLNTSQSLFQQQVFLKKNLQDICLCYTGTKIKESSLLVLLIVLAYHFKQNILEVLGLLYMASNIAEIIMGIIRRLCICRLFLCCKEHVIALCKPHRHVHPMSSVRTEKMAMHYGVEWIHTSAPFRITS